MPRKGALLKAVVQTLVTHNEEGGNLTQVLNLQVLVNQGRKEGRPTLPRKAQERLDALDDSNEILYEIQKFRIIAREHLQYRCKRDRLADLSDFRIEKRMRSRIRSLEQQAYMIGSLERLPEYLKGPPAKVRTEGRAGFEPRVTTK